MHCVARLLENDTTALALDSKGLPYVLELSVDEHCLRGRDRSGHGC